MTAFSPVDEIEEKIASLNQAVQRKGIILNVEMEAEDEITAAVVLLLLVMLCGFLLIYNIFRISVISDIHFIVFAVAFSVITVWVSSRTAVSLAKRISPTEASRFHSSGKMKRIFAMLSFALGGTLCCAIFTVFTGYDTEWMVKRENESDFVVEQWHSKQLMDEPYEPMTEEFVQGIRNLDFVKESYLFYRARSARCDKMKQNGIFGESTGEVKMEGHYKEIMKKEFQELGLEKEDWDFLVEEGRAETGIVGMEPDALDMEMENVDILDGKADVCLFASGDYLIYQPFAIPPDRKKKDYLKYGMKAGDKVTVSFWNSDLWEYQTRTFTIMAVVTKKNDNYAGTMCDGGVQFIMPDRVFKDVYKDSAKKMISALRMNTSGRKPEMEQKTIDQMIKENFNFQIQSGSRYKTRQEEEKKRVQELYIGILFGCIVAMIGIVNIINTLVTDVVSRKLEFSTMHSIGMTKRQMAAKICLDGIRMVLAGGIPVCFLAFFLRHGCWHLLYL